MDKEKIREKIESGKLNPLEAYAEIKESIKEYEEVLSHIEDLVKIEAQEVLDYNKAVNVNDCLFTLKKGRAMWDYKKVTNWSKIKAELKSEEDTLKAKYDLYLKGQLEGKHELPTLTYAKDSISYQFIND